MDEKNKKSRLSGLYDDLWGKTVESVKSSSNHKTERNAQEEMLENMGVSDIAKLLDELRQTDELFLKKQRESNGGTAKPGTVDPALNEKESNDVRNIDESDTSVQNDDKNGKKEPEIPETDPMEELEALTGLAKIKSDVQELIAFVKTQKLRKDNGMKTVPVSLHLVFTGNPGTGKTTVARLMARLYKQIGVLSKGQLVEVDRSALVAGFVGQTAIQTAKKIEEALGGILFIDEAYTLAKEGGNDFGQEAIDTILKGMEDHRDDLVVIVAGYPDLMKKFIDSNPGLKSRFNKYFYFEDYTPEELKVIFDSMCKKYDYIIEESCEQLVAERLKKMEEEKDANFANAREVRNLFEQMITNQAARVAKMEEPSVEDLKMITKDDLIGEED